MREIPVFSRSPDEVKLRAWPNGTYGFFPDDGVERFVSPAITTEALLAIVADRGCEATDEMADAGADAIEAASVADGEHIAPTREDVKLAWSAMLKAATRSPDTKQEAGR